MRDVPNHGKLRPVECRADRQRSAAAPFHAARNSPPKAPRPSATSISPSATASTMRAGRVWLAVIAIESVAAHIIDDARGAPEHAPEACSSRHRQSAAHRRDARAARGSLNEATAADRRSASRTRSWSDNRERWCARLRDCSGSPGTRSQLPAFNVLRRKPRRCAHQV